MIRRMSTWAWAHPIGTLIVAGLVTVHLAASVRAIACVPMSLAECVGTAFALTAGAALLATAGRACWLASRTARAMRGLRQVPPAPLLRAAAHRAGVRRLRVVAGDDCTAFCAGLLFPRVYVTAGTADRLAPAELEGILVHEVAHARRRDPLRRLVARAAVDALFYLPLVRWWAARQAENQELRADRVAIETAGSKAVARAMLAASAGPVLAAGIDGPTEARLAQLLGDGVPVRRPPMTHVALSLLGLVGAVWLTMCVGQIAVATLGA